MAEHRRSTGGSYGHRQKNTSSRSRHGGGSNRNRQPDSSSSSSTITSQGSRSAGGRGPGKEFCEKGDFEMVTGNSEERRDRLCIVGRKFRHILPHKFRINFLNTELHEREPRDTDGNASSASSDASQQGTTPKLPQEADKTIGAWTAWVGILDFKHDTKQHDRDYNKAWQMEAGKVPKHKHPNIVTSPVQEKKPIRGIKKSKPAPDHEVPELDQAQEPFGAFKPVYLPSPNSKGSTEPITPTPIYPPSHDLTSEEKVNKIREFLTHAAFSMEEYSKFKSLDIQLEDITGYCSEVDNILKKKRGDGGGGDASDHSSAFDSQSAQDGDYAETADELIYSDNSDAGPIPAEPLEPSLSMSETESPISHNSPGLSTLRDFRRERSSLAISPQSSKSSASIVKEEIIHKSIRKPSRSLPTSHMPLDEPANTAESPELTEEEESTLEAEPVLENSQSDAGSTFSGFYSDSRPGKVEVIDTPTSPPQLKCEPLIHQIAIKQEIDDPTPSLKDSYTSHEQFPDSAQSPEEAADSHPAATVAVKPTLPVGKRPPSAVQPQTPTLSTSSCQTTPAQSFSAHSPKIAAPPRVKIEPPSAQQQQMQHQAAAEESRISILDQLKADNPNYCFLPFGRIIRVHGYGAPDSTPASSHTTTTATPASSIRTPHDVGSSVSSVQQGHAKQTAGQKRQSQSPATHLHVPKTAKIQKTSQLTASDREISECTTGYSSAAAGSQSGIDYAVAEAQAHKSSDRHQRRLHGDVDPYSPSIPNSIASSRGPSPSVKRSKHDMASGLSHMPSSSSGYGDHYNPALRTPDTTAAHEPEKQQLVASKFKPFKQLVSEFSSSTSDLFKTGHEQLKFLETEMTLKKTESAERRICLLDALHVSVKAVKCITLMLLGVANNWYACRQPRKPLTDHELRKKSRRLNMVSEKIGWILKDTEESLKNEIEEAGSVLENHGNGVDDCSYSDECTVAKFFLVTMYRVQGIIQRQQYLDKKQKGQPDGQVEVMKLVQRIERLCTKKAYAQENQRHSTHDRSYGLSDDSSSAESLPSGASAGNQGSSDHHHRGSGGGGGGGAGGGGGDHRSRRDSLSDFSKKDAIDLDHYNYNYFLMTKFLARAEHYWQKSIEIMDDVCASYRCDQALNGSSSSNSISFNGQLSAGSVQSICNSGFCEAHASSGYGLYETSPLDTNACLHLQTGPHFHHHVHYQRLKRLESRNSSSNGRQRKSIPSGGSAYGTAPTGNGGADYQNSKSMSAATAANDACSPGDKIATDLLQALRPYELRYHTCLGETACLLYAKWQVFMTTVEGLI